MLTIDPVRPSVSAGEIGPFIADELYPMTVSIRTFGYEKPPESEVHWPSRITCAIPYQFRDCIPAVVVMSAYDEHVEYRLSSTRWEGNRLSDFDTQWQGENRYGEYPVCEWTLFE